MREAGRAKHRHLSRYRGLHAYATGALAKEIAKLSLSVLRDKTVTKWAYSEREIIVF
jgi:hypothetical protein